MSDRSSDEPDPERLKALEERLARMRKANEPRPQRADHHLSQADLAWRMVIEMVSGLGIGFGIGYGLDRAFGTLPVCMVLFTLLGFVAGVKVMLRSAQEVRQEAKRQEVTGKRAAAAAAEEEGNRT